MNRADKREELTAELNKLDGFESKVEAKRDMILNEYIEFLIKDYASVMKSTGPLTAETLLSGFAKEIRKLYER